MPSNPDPHDRSPPGWHRQPVLWLGIAIFLASIAGCVWLIVVSVRHADTPLATSHAVFGVPVNTHSTAQPAPASSAP
ncbi:MAG TPA: hypothetical protein VN043_02055 [Rhodanobacter sp.]|nr:hypothetical protein [Rhodanobacter sp.]